MNLTEILLNHFEYYGMNAPQNQLKAWAWDLRDFDPMKVYSAIQLLQKQPERTRPATPAMIIDKIMGYQSAEQAWATVPKNLHDESETYVMSEEARLAWGQVISLLKESNIVQAFIAFKEAYAKELEISRQKRVKVKFSISEGLDKKRRDDVIKIAYQDGRLSRDNALERNQDLALPAPEERYQGLLASSEKPMLAAPASAEEDLSEEKKKQRITDIQKFLKTVGKKSEDAFQEE